jgi:hypothetical protein
MVAMTEKITEPRMRVTTSAELLAAVPHLMGFTPEDSMVVIGTEPPQARVKLTLRYDLPDPPDPDAAADLAAHAAAIFSEQGIITIVVVGYGPARLVTPIADALHTTLGLPLRNMLRVEGGRYWSYDESPSEGTPFDVAAELVDVEGTPLADRAELAARVAPLGITCESMRHATRQAEQHTAQLLAESADRGAARHMIAAEGLAEVGAMIARYQDGGGFTTDDEIAWITVALRDLRVRDDAWARMDPAFKAQDVKLWTDVVRRAQPRYVAAPASLLAFVAWQSGNGALANVALDRALADDPRYSMALLLRQVITAGAPPSLARLPMTPEEVAGSYDEAGSEAADSEASKLTEES